MDKYKITLSNRDLKCECVVLMTTSQKIAKRLVTELNSNKNSVFGACETCPLLGNENEYSRDIGIDACEAKSDKIKR